MLASDSNERIYDLMADFWSAQTSYTPQEWSAENPARGQSMPTALAVQKYLGGEIVKARLSFANDATKETHYWNIIGEDEVDATFVQYQNRKIVDETFIGIVQKADILSDPDTRRRYEILLDTIKASVDLDAFFKALKA